jgi:hypothetical protein
MYEVYVEFLHGLKERGLPSQENKAKFLMKVFPGMSGF